MSYYGVVAKVKPNSVADDIGLQPGDKILAVNDMPLTDIIDFSFATADEESFIFLTGNADLCKDSRRNQ